MNCKKKVIGTVYDTRDPKYAERFVGPETPCYYNTDENPAIIPIGIMAEIEAVVPVGPDDMIHVWFDESGRPECVDISSRDSEHSPRNIEIILDIPGDTDIRNGRPLSERVTAAAIFSEIVRSGEHYRKYGHFPGERNRFTVSVT